MLIYHTKLVVLMVSALAILFPACSSRPTKLPVLTEQVYELAVQVTSPDCQISVLKTPPSQPYDVIAKVKTYGNPDTDQAEMDHALYQEACAIGAQAVIVQNLNESDLVNEVSMTHLGGGNTRDDPSTSEYAPHIGGLAIRYKDQESR